MIVTTVILPPVDENHEAVLSRSLDLERTMSGSSEYTREAHAAQDTPLLEDEQANEHRHRIVGTTTNLLSVDADTTRLSIDSAMSSEDVGHMHEVPIAQRGAAPPYSEVASVDDSGIDIADNSRSTEDDPDGLPTGQPESSPSDNSSPSNAADQAQDRPQPQRTSSVGGLSGFFGGLFNPRSSVSARAQASAPPTLPTELVRERAHLRDNSTPSMASLATNGAERRTHRPTVSGSGSVLSLGSSVFRTRSRTPGLELLNSPSTISLHSISAPLSHTLIRTEFTYPKTGPTAEQMKLISSRDSFARFGVPYGESAIAFAASTSRVSLDQPPPEFEEVERPSRTQPRSSSSAEQNASDEAAEVPSAPTPQSSETQAADGQADPSEELPEGVKQESEESSLSVPPSEANSPCGSQNSERSRSPVRVVEEAQQSSGGAEAETESSPAADEISEHADTSAPASLSARSTKSFLPPSSYKPVGASSLRAPSRASSYTSFATAEEFESTPSTPVMSVMNITVGSGTPSASSPSTPRLGTRHIHEDTDTTITSPPPSTDLFNAERVVEAH